MILYLSFLLFSIQIVNGAKIFIGTIPIIGHLRGQIIIAKELLSRGHSITFATTLNHDKGSELLKQIADHPRVTLVDVANWGDRAWEDDLWEQLSIANEEKETKGGNKGLEIIFGPLLYYNYEEALKKFLKAMPGHDFAICDYDTYQCSEAADEHDVPSCVLAPGNNPLAISPDAEFPALSLGGIAFPMPVLARFVSHAAMQAVVYYSLVQHMVNQPMLEARARLLPKIANDGSQMLRHYNWRPQIYGTAVGSIGTNAASSPHVHHVGFFWDDDERQTPLSRDEEALLSGSSDTHPDGVVVLNFGTTGFALGQQIDAVLGAAAKMNKVLFVWRVSAHEQAKINARLAGKKAPSNVRFIAWFTSQRAVLKHERVRVFVSHAGYNSPFDAMSAGVPIVAMPVFADQPDTAARIVEAGLGLRLDRTKATPDNFAATVRELMARYDAIHNTAKRLEKINRFAGGVKRVADLVEHWLDVGYEHELHMQWSKNAPFWRRAYIDVALPYMLIVIVPVVLTIVILRCLCSCCCGKQKVKKE